MSGIRDGLPDKPGAGAGSGDITIGADPGGTSVAGVVDNGDITIGVDLGGTNIVAGAVDSDGNVLRKLKRPTPAGESQEAVLARIADMALELVQDYKGERPASALGVGVPGLVDPGSGIARHSTNLGFRDLNVAQRLGRMTGLPVYIDNDVRMYVLGETLAGAGKGFEYVLGITIGTGIAAAMVNRGELYYGFKAMAGEIGHIRMEGVEERCACGLIGCLETAASASAMARQAKRAVRAGRPSLLAQWFPGEAVEQLTAADLSRAMDAGDALAAEIITRAGKLVGQALATAVMMLSPQVIVIGGGGALAGERLMAPLREELKQRVLPDYVEDLQVLTAVSNDDAGIIGSALYARGRALRSATS